MQLEIKNFGGFRDKIVEFDAPSVITLPNGYGKTTIINAFVFVLTGKALSGFEARNVDTPADEPTVVTLSGYLPVKVRRVLASDGGTNLYVDSFYMAQNAFAERYPVDFMVACANVNLLTNPDLSSEKLRKLLSITGAMQTDRSDELRKEQKELREKRRQAEPYALSNIVIPTHVIAPLSESEELFVTDYEKHSDTIRKGVETACPTCGRGYDADKVKAQRKSLLVAKTFVDAHAKEYDRLHRQECDFREEQIKIADAKRLANTAKRARADVVRFDERLAQIEIELREADARAVSSVLPDGVEIKTERTTKTGKSSSACTLTHNGVPLKSVNRGERIKICIELLQQAITRMQGRYVILVDNAECVQGLEHYDNVVQFKVG